MWRRVPVGASWGCILMHVLGIKTRKPERLDGVCSCRAKKSSETRQRRFQNLLNCGCSRNGQSTIRLNLEILLVSALEGT